MFDTASYVHIFSFKWSTAGVFIVLYLSIVPFSVCVQRWCNADMKRTGV